MITTQKHRRFPSAEARLKGNEAKWEIVWCGDQSKFEIPCGNLELYVLHTKEERDSLACTCLCERFFADKLFACMLLGNGLSLIQVDIQNSEWSLSCTCHQATSSTPIRSHLKAKCLSHSFNKTHLKSINFMFYRFYSVLNQLVKIHVLSLCLFVFFSPDSLPRWVQVQGEFAPEQLQRLRVSGLQRVLHSTEQAWPCEEGQQSHYCHDCNTLLTTNMMRGWG